ncbi:MAG: SDR family NAD(P)-dependent oxidoreductase [Planctomycetes bacterium]|nr:SDR family NAD(P)-dependent oxidoreductase [Planctomycetota bacterium]
MSHATESAPHAHPEAAGDQHAAAHEPRDSTPSTKRARERRAIVVGASSGIGEALVRQLCAEGVDVVALARRRERLEELALSCGGSAGRVIPCAHDVSDFAAVPQLFEALVRELGGLDLFVFASGLMTEVGPNEFDTAKDLEMLAVNLGGCVAWTNEVAKLFRTQRSGVIVGISSIAGERGRKGNPVYGTSKAAMNHYLEALRNRLADFDVHVCTIKPGFVETAMLAAARAQGRSIKGAITPEAAAKSILRAARARRNEVFVPFKWTLVAAVIRNIPSFLFKGMNI